MTCFECRGRDEREVACFEYGGRDEHIHGNSPLELTKVRLNAKCLNGYPVIELNVMCLLKSKSNILIDFDFMV